LPEPSSRTLCRLAAVFSPAMHYAPRRNATLENCRPAESFLKEPRSFGLGRANLLLRLSLGQKMIAREFMRWE
jgi:hypothetical protein